MENLSPICLFVYNRFNETKLTIDSLKNNFLAQQSDLIIFSDGPKAQNDLKLIKDIRGYLKKINGFKSIKIYESSTNKGLAQSVIYGVTLILNQYDKVIVLEDDLITTPNFLDFMNQGLEEYSKNNKVMSINGFSVDTSSATNRLTNDVFFHSRTLSWGWATWSDRWNKEFFNSEKIRSSLTEQALLSFKKNCGDDISRMLLDSLSGKNDSWYVRWAFRHFIEGKLAVFPVLSKVRNNGYGDSATHCKTIDVLKTRYDNKFSRVFNFPDDIRIDKSTHKRILNYYSFSYKLIYRFLLLFKPNGIYMIFKDIKYKLF